MRDSIGLAERCTECGSPRIAWRSQNGSFVVCRSCRARIDERILRSSFGEDKKGRQVPLSTLSERERKKFWPVRWQQIYPADTSWDESNEEFIARYHERRAMRRER